MKKPKQFPNKGLGIWIVADFAAAAGEGRWWCHGHKTPRESELHPWILLPNSLSSPKAQKVQLPRHVLREQKEAVSQIQCQPRRTMAWQPRKSISPHPRETREVPRLTGPGWSRDGGSRMRSPGEKELRSLACLTVCEAPGHAWDNLTSSKSCPLHTCSVRSAQHPAPPASTAPISSALLYFFFILSMVLITS